MDKDNILSKIAINIKLQRIKNNLNQDNLAELSGISQKYLSAIERAKVNPSITIIINICRVLKIDLNEIYKIL